MISWWTCFSPITTRPSSDRQGPDSGTQYRSAIFTHGEAQARIAREKEEEALDKSEKWRQPVVTTIEPAPAFWRAEDYHQRYFEKNGLPSCHVTF